MSATDSLKLGTEATIMAIREYLMSYFKDSYTCYVSEHTNVAISGNVHFDPERRTRNYERQVANIRAPKLIKIGSSTIMEVEKKPDTIKMYNRAFNRSDEMKAIREGIDKFLDKFLRGVTVTELQKGSFARANDKEMISSNSPSFSPLLLKSAGRNQVLTEELLAEIEISQMAGMSQNLTGTTETMYSPVFTGTFGLDTAIPYLHWTRDEAIDD